jgi:hypothetical protein
VFAIVQREAMVSRHVWESRPLLDRVDPEEAEPFAEALATKRATQSLAHVFTVLSLVLLENRWVSPSAALQTDDERLRGNRAGVSGTDPAPGRFMSGSRRCSTAPDLRAARGDRLTPSSPSC